MILILLILNLILINSTILLIAPSNATDENKEIADYIASGTDDQNIIQTAICSLKELSAYWDTNDKSCGYQTSIPDNDDEDIKKKGGIIKLLPGTFNISGQIFLYANQIFEGSGIDITILDLDPDGPKFGNSGIIRIAYTGNVIIRDFTINGNKKSNIYDKTDDTHYGRFGFYTLQAYDIRCKRLRIKNCPGYGFDPHGIPGSDGKTTYLVIEDCYSENNNLDGYTIDKSDYVIIKNNFALNNERHGFELTTGTTDIQFIGNHAINNGWGYMLMKNGNPTYKPGCGIKAQDQINAGQRWGSKDAIFTNNIIKSSASYGICLTELKEVIVSNNIILNNSEGCIELRNSDDSDMGVDDSNISNNLCINNSLGIKLVQSFRNVIIGNIIRNTLPTEQYGLYLEDSSNNVIDNNIIIKTRGIKLENSPYNNINNPLKNIEDVSEDAPIVDLDNIVSLEIISNKHILLKYNQYRVVKTFKKEEDFLTTNISSISNNGRLYNNIYIKIILNIYDPDGTGLENYYPERFEYTSNGTNNNNGIIFNMIPDPDIGWVSGTNIITHSVQDDEYYGLINFIQMNRLQIYWTKKDSNYQPPAEMYYNFVSITLTNEDMV